jgi:hypothetical protein
VAKRQGSGIRQWAALGAAHRADLALGLVQRRDQKTPADLIEVVRQPPYIRMPPRSDVRNRSETLSYSIRGDRPSSLGRSRLAVV